MIALCFDEPEHRDVVQNVFGTVERQRVHVPGRWRLEVANALVVAERRGRIVGARLAEFLADLDDLEPVVDTSTDDRAWTSILALARGERLSAYDAAYLELARRLELPLATVDRALGRAATRLGISTIT